MTASVLLDVTIPDAVLLEHLAGHPAGDVLAFCGSVLNVLARSERDDGQQWAVQTFLRGAHRRRAEAMIKDDWALLTPQVVLASAKLRLLLRDATPPRDGNLLAGETLTAILGIADRLSAEREDDAMWGLAPRWLVVEMLQNLYFNATRDVGSVLARGRRVRTIMRELDPTLAAWLDDLFEELTKTPFDTVTAVGLALYAGTAQSPSVAPTYFDKMDFDPAARRAALEVVAGSIDDLRRDAAAEFRRVPGKSGFDWGYNVFRKYPALRHPDGRIFTLHPGYLVDRCAFDAYELKVRNALRQRSNAGDGVARKHEGAAGDLFGHAHEQYAGESVDAQLPKVPGGARQVWAEADFKKAWPRRKHCDYLADYGEALVAIDIVSKRLVEQTYGAGVIESLEADLRQIVDKKAIQIDSTLRMVIERGDELGLPRRGDPGSSVPIFPIVVSTAGLPWNPMIAAVVHERIANAAILTHARVRPLRVITLENLEETEALSAAGGPSLGRLLVDAHGRDEDGFAIDDIIDSRGYRLRRPDRLDPLWIDAFRDLGASYGMDAREMDRLPASV
jgi:hypothetical protein